MNISPAEAEEALAAIQTMVHKTRRAISNSGAYAFLIVWCGASSGCSAF